MKVLAVKDDFKCAVLGLEDWDIYRDLTVKMHAELKAAGTTDALADMMENARLCFSAEGYIPFGLFSGDDIIGHTHIVMPPLNGQTAPQLNASYILEPFRGQGLGDLLYEARLKYLTSQTDYQNVTTEI